MVDGRQSLIQNVKVAQNEHDVLATLFSFFQIGKRFFVSLSI